MDNKNTDVNITDAVREILTYILEKSLWSINNLRLNVRVKSRKQDLSSSTRFCVKVSSTCQLTTADLTAYRFPHLYGMLRTIQSTDPECHLCLQYPSLDDQQGSTLENIILVDNKLSVQKKLQKPKQTNVYTVFLKVHQELWQMSEECGNIHKFMLLSKVFRPKDEFNFSMTLGEVVSETDFRVKWWRKVSSEIPEIVTDSSFYLDKEILDSDEPCNVEPCISSPLRLRKVLQPHSRVDLGTLQVIGLCFPLARSGVDQTRESSYINVTVFGPAFLPCKEPFSRIRDMVGCVDWGLYGLKIMSPVAASKKHVQKGHFCGLLRHNKSWLMDRVHLEIFLVVHTDRQSGDSVYEDTVIQSAIEDQKAEVGRKIAEVVDQILQPILLKMKTRDMVHKSIKSVCKGIVDIISMSSSDEFHSKVLEVMNVQDTVELGQKVESELRRISARKHSRVWGGNFLFDKTVVHDEGSHLSEDQVVPTIFTQSENVDLYSGLKVHGKTGQNVEDSYLSSVELKSARVDKQNLISMEMGESLTKPEIYVAPCGNKREDTRKSNCGDGKAVLSPFHELGLTEEGDFHLDKTPEITQLTKSMKEVSPFQELAVTDIDLISESLVENPFAENIDKITNVGFATDKTNHTITSQKFENLVDKRQPVKRPSTEVIRSSKEFRNFSRSSQSHLYYRTYTQADNNETLTGACTESKMSRVQCTGSMDDTALLMDNVEHNEPKERNIPISRSLFEETALLQTEKQVDCLDDDSEDWFNDVLVGVENWLK